MIVFEISVIFINKIGYCLFYFVGIIFESDIFSIEIGSIDIIGWWIGGRYFFFEIVFFSSKIIIC